MRPLERTAGAVISAFGLRVAVERRQRASRPSSAFATRRRGAGCASRGRHCGRLVRGDFGPHDGLEDA